MGTVECCGFVATYLASKKKKKNNNLYLSTGYDPFADGVVVPGLSRLVLGRCPGRTIIYHTINTFCTINTVNTNNTS